MFDCSTFKFQIFLKKTLKPLLLNVKIFIIEIFIRDREYFIIIIINSK